MPVVRDAGEVFNSNFEALEEYQKHVSAGRWFSWLNWGAVGAYVLYASISSANDNYKRLGGLRDLLRAVGAGAYMLGKSNAHLLRAVNLMNGVPPPRRGVPGAAAVRLPLFAWSFDDRPHPKVLHAALIAVRAGPRARVTP